ncbi:MAG: DMT family transporter [Desulfofustis sp.]|nr:DMT family transporter [Desulfofustis sp.]
MSCHSDRRKPLVFILAGAVCISFSGVWVTWSDVDPTVSAFYRVFFGSLFLAIACLLRHEFQRISLKAWLLTVLCGLCFAADLYCWHASIFFIGPGLATIIGNFQVFVLTLVSLAFFGERIRPLFFLSLPLAFFGLLLIIGFNWSSLSSDYRTGIYLGLATALFYSAFLLLLRRIQKVQQSLSFFFSLMLVSLSTAFFLALSIWSSGSSFRISGLVPVGSLLCLGLFSQTIGWSFIANSLPKVSPSVAGLVLLLQPSLAFVWDVLIFARPTSSIHWLGVGITLLAIYLGMTASRTRRPITTGSQMKKSPPRLATNRPTSYNNGREEN